MIQVNFNIKKVRFRQILNNIDVYRLLFLFAVLFNVNISFADPVKTVYSIVSGASWTNGSHWSTTSGGASCSCVPDVSKDIIYIETNTSSAAGLTLGASVNVTVKIETKEIAYKINLFGQEVNENYKGIVLIIYTDGSSVKIIQ